ncbi:unnamed protein product [Eruca vesicaria subsp. sativa]|uniref:EF-hand domain-containing protein n=1 Tax=Eruca vesicaria subsp. sativa TaxID=29727 RepID=A0ABC8KPH5_ERUVS|nr:unnamed protein product [Eruca vesicaria subsp. sativa]
MQELHEAAIAYYNNGSTDQQNLAWQFFRSMDGDGDGRVSFHEYTDFLYRTTGFGWVHREMFQELDRNGDGQLDFWEVLTLYYVARTRTILCRTCLQPLIGLYFTCVTCFESQSDGDTFDLCVKCYMQRNCNHPHRVFLDSYVLLRSKRSHQPLEPPGEQNMPEQPPERVGWWYAMTAMDLAIAMGSLTGFCTIM